MSNSGKNATLESEQSFEELLGHAAPRPSPSRQDAAIAREAVRQDWLEVVNSRKRQRRFYTLATAAVMVLAVTVALNLTGPPPPLPVQVATIDNSVGSIYVLGEESKLQATGDLSSIAAGQTIVTDKDSTLGLVWENGGSLRLAEDSRVLFAAANEIELVSGKIYFDSNGGESKLSIDTSLGKVQHLGTRFMTNVDANTLSVSVRDGRVEVDGIYFKEMAAEKQRLTLRGSSRAEFVDIRPYGPDWEWIEATAPIESFNGQTLYRFLQWVAAETGFEIAFETKQLKANAEEWMLKDDVSAEPRVALGQRLETLGLDFDLQFEQGVILIVEREGS